MGVTLVGEGTAVMLPLTCGTLFDHHLATLRSVVGLAALLPVDVINIILIILLLVLIHRHLLSELIPHEFRLVFYRQSRPFQEQSQ